MNIGGGEASEQAMRLALQGSEIVVRLGGTLAKNIAAMMLALYKNHKMLYGKKNLGRILRSDLRDVRKFSMSMEQFKEFRKMSKKYKVLYSAVGDRGRAAKRPGAVIDLMLPVEEIARANMAFERIGYTAKQEPEALWKEEQTPKKESRSREGSRDTRSKTNTRDRAGMTKTNEKPSVEEKLKGYQAQNRQTAQKQPVKTKKKSKGKVK